MELTQHDVTVALCENPNLSLPAMADKFTPPKDEVKAAIVKALELDRFLNVETREQLWEGKLSLANAASIAKLPLNEQLLLHDLQVIGISPPLLATAITKYLARTTKKCSKTKTKNTRPA